MHLFIPALVIVNYLLIRDILCCVLLDRAFWSIAGLFSTCCSASLRTLVSHPAGWDTHTPHSSIGFLKKIWGLNLLLSSPHRLPVLLRSATMGRCLPRPSPGTPTPPRSTAPGHRAWPWATGREAACWRPVWAPVESPVWESTRWMDPRQRHSHFWPGEKTDLKLIFFITLHLKASGAKLHFESEACFILVYMWSK